MFRRTTPRPHRATRLPLWLERLEDRTVPSVYDWNVNASGNWNDPNNWQVAFGQDGGYPHTAGDTARLLGVITAGRTITIPDGVNISLGTLQINSANNYTIAAAGSGRLGFDNTGTSDAVLLVGNGNGFHTISAPITLVDDLEVTVQSTITPLNISGPVAEALFTRNPGLSLTGPGILRLSGSAANTFTGATTVRSGVLELFKSGGANAFGGDLVVGDGSGAAAVARNVVDNNIPAASSVTVNADGVYNLSGQSESIGPLVVNGGSVTVGAGLVSFPALTMTGGSMTTTTGGVIQLLGNATINASVIGSTISGTGALDLGGGIVTRTFTVAAAAELNISLEVRASALFPPALTKDGPGTMRLSGPGMFASITSLNAGTLRVGDNTALGTGRFVINGGTIQADGLDRTLANVFSIGGDFTVAGSLDLTFTGAATLIGNRTVTVTSTGFANFRGAVGQDTAGRALTKAGAGTLRLSGTASNTYSGTTTVADGTLELEKTPGAAAFSGNLVVGDGVGLATSAVAENRENYNIPAAASVTVNGDGLYDAGEETDDFGPLVVNGGTASAAFLSVSTLTMTGGTIYVFGTLSLSSPAMTGGRIIADSNGEIRLNGDVTATSSPAGGSATIVGGHVLMSNAVGSFTVNEGPAAIDLGIDSEIRGTALVKAGPGTMALGGATSNTYTGTTTVSAGTLELNKTGSGTAAVPAALTINGGVVREVLNNQIADAGVVNVNAGSQFDLNGQSDTVGTLTVTGGTVKTSGTGAGRLTAGNTSFNAAATLAMNLAGATTSDRITANGMVAVGGALQLNLATAVPLGTVITLIDNDGTDTVAGTFSGLPEGALLVVGGQTFSMSYSGGTGNDVVLTRVNPPGVLDVQVNGGAAQRSMVTSLTVTFSSQVTLGPGAFTLVPQGGGAPVALSFTTAVVSGGTVATITFPGATGGSLADGRYVLTTVAAQIRDLAGTAMAADRQDTLFRLFGDVNGDAGVNGLDLTAFRNAFGTVSTDAGYAAYLDFNGDGVINGTDLTAFRSRFGAILP